MQQNGEEFRKKLLFTFRGEAEDHVRELGSGLMGLDKAPAGTLTGTLETVFRAAHSLKGAARAVDEKETENLCQALESALAGLKKAGAAPRPAELDLLLKAVRTLEELCVRTGDGKPEELRARAAGLAAALEGAAPPGAADRPAAAPRTAADGAGSAAPHAEENVRVPLATLESLLRQTEEMLASKLSSGQRCAELKATLSEISGMLRGWPARQAASGTEYLETAREELRGLERSVRAVLQAMEQDQRALGARIDLLHEEMKQTLMLPFATLVQGFPLFFREALRSQGKEAELEMRGTELAVDRRILQEMKDPLMHLLRNAVDHGIEKPEARKRKGKPPVGRVAIEISKKEGNKAEILVRDDGAGIDAAKVADAAARLGLAADGASEKDGKAAAEALIFKSGVSTSPILTSLSGRGLGLAIARDKVERLGGSICAEGGEGTTSFRITLPLALSTMRGILVEAGGEMFAVPLPQVERVGRAGRNDIRTVEGRPAVSSAGGELPLARLAEALGLETAGPAREGDYAQYIVAAPAAGGQAFLVDRVLMEQELLVKALDAPLSSARFASGAAVLGSGQVVPMLNMRGLAETATRGAAPAPRRAAPERRKAVLVVEDSITSRTLLKNIFEAAGYEVRAAVDGAAGFEQLRSFKCDLVVSDVDMPKMNGFELTARIRGDKDLSALPVVLVTALESDRDREKGIEAGANAYMVKSRFDQSDILEIAGRLLG